MHNNYVPNFKRDDYCAEMLKILEMFGEIPTALLQRMMSDLTPAFFYQRFMFLRNNGTIMCASPETVSLNKTKKMDDKTVDALWVLADFKQQGNMKFYGDADYPARAFFVRKDDTGREFQYEICVLDDHDEAVLRIMKFFPYIKYIFVVPDKDCIKRYAKVLNDMDVKLKRCLFAIVKHSGDNPIPSICYYGAEEVYGNG